MKRFFLFSLLPGLVFAAGCSKQTEESIDFAAPADYDQSPAAQQQPVSRQLNAVQADLQAKNYRALTERMEALNRMPKTQEEEQQYRKAYFEVSETLRQQAEVDPAAEQAYRNFGRRMMGR